MPILHLQYSLQAKIQDGSEVEVPPSAALQARGPCVQVQVELHRPMAKVLAEKGEEVPPTKTGWAMIDTGASHTCVDDAMAQALKLPVVGSRKISSASNAESDRNVYPVSLEIAGLGTLDVSDAIGVELERQGIVALIGRSALSAFVLIYNGPGGQLALTV